MKLNINYPSLFIAILLSGFSHNLYAENAETRIIKKQILINGFIPSRQIYKNPDEKLVPIGKVIFESKKLSLNGNISCQTCHLDRFGSTDGIPSAAAVGATGEGPRRLLNGAKQLPRNALALWGVGANGFDTFFWDGKIDFSYGNRISQFGSQLPSNDSLVIADHLPVVEIREMLEEDGFIEGHKSESVDKAQVVYQAIVDRLKMQESKASKDLAKALNKNENQLIYTDYARSLAAFIRSKFQIKETKLEKVMSNKASFSSEELKGARIFYGKGACITCHSGPHFSDFKFYSVPFPQLGFGKNGFGVDYGRYNITFDPKDLYKFRTAPLYNVEKTSPYGHSGSVRTLNEAVVAHYDPLSLITTEKMSSFDRHEFAKRLGYSDSTKRVSYLNSTEVDQVTSFLKTLSF